MKRIDAKTVASIFINNIVCRHSAPSILLSDQGAQFRSELLRSICEYLKTKKINTTAYHPQCNGLTERFNSTLCQIVAIYSNENQNNWDEYIPTALFAYNISQQETTTLPPFEVLYGRQPNLPSDFDRIRSDSDPKTIDFTNKWNKAFERIQKVNNKRKQKIDNNHKIKSINIGDDVRLHTPATKVGRKFKLRGDIWSGPFKVIGKAPNGNLKLNINKKNPYIVHPNRVKLAEQSFERFPPETKKLHPPKQVKFNEAANIVHNF